MKRLALALSVLAAAVMHPLISHAAGLCTAENGVKYNPQQIFDDLHPCYIPRPEECPPPGSVCANHALIKLGNYQASDHQDLVYSPHRGLWGQTYGSTDPDFTVPPAQNSIQAFNLVNSFVTGKGGSAEGREYGKFLRGRIAELDITTSGDDVEKPLVLIDHYLTTANTAQGSINDYLTDIDEKRLRASQDNIENRDLSASPMTLGKTPIDVVTKGSIVSPDDSDFGVITYHDIKSRGGDIQCQTSKIKPDDRKKYERYRCKHGDRSKARKATFADQIRSAQAMADAGGQKNVVIKTSATFKEMRDAVMEAHGDPSEENAERFMKGFMWQPYPVNTGKGKDSIQGMVQYIHGWLTYAPRSVQAWESNIFYPGDETNLPFCVTNFDRQTGRIDVDLVDPANPGPNCKYGPYVNILDYIRQETGTPDYFGFDEQQKQQGYLSGNRANLWLLDTAAAAGTADRYYRWQMLGSDPEYDMSDPVKLLHYPYAAYQIVNGDRMDAVYQIIKKQMYAKWAPTGPLAKAARPRKPGGVQVRDADASPDGFDRRRDEDDR